MRAVTTSEGSNPIGACQKIGERAQHQAGGQEGHDRQRHLCNDEAALQRAAAHHRGSGAARIERPSQGVAGEEQRRYQAEQHAARHGEPGRPQHDDAVDRDVGLPRQVDRPKPLEHADAGVRQQQAARAAEHREHEVLREELPDETEPRGAERAAHGQFTLAGLRPRQHQVGDIDARDQQHEPDGGAEHHQRRLDVARHDFTQRTDREAQLLVRIRAWMLRDERRGSRVTLGLGVRDRRAWREPPDERSAPIQSGRREAEREPDIDALFHVVGGRQIDTEVRPRHADHLHVIVVHDEMPADDPRVSLESPLPQFVTDHDAQDDEIARVPGLDERPPERQRRCPQQRQQVVGHPRPRDPLHRAIDRKARIAAFDRGDVGDQIALVPRIEDRAGRRVRAGQARRDRLDRHDPAGIGVGQRSPEHGVDDAEDRDVDADAERDRQDDDQRVTRRAPEDTTPVPGVAHGGREGESDPRGRGRVEPI